MQWKGCGGCRGEWRGGQGTNHCRSDGRWHSAVVNSKWPTLASIWATVTICGDRVYLTGSLDQHGHPAQSVFTCSLSVFLQLRTVGAKMKTLSLAGNHTVWHTITDLPVKGSTCATLNEQLLAVSGFDRYGKYTNNIYSYNTQTNSWHFGIRHLGIRHSGNDSSNPSFFPCRVYNHCIFQLFINEIAVPAVQKKCKFLLPLPLPPFFQNV